MQIKDGKVKLQKRDKRFGNFVVTNEYEHYKVQTIGTEWSLRVGKDTIIGRFIKEGIAAGGDGLHHIISYLYYISASAVDVDAMAATIALYRASSMRAKIKQQEPVVVFASAQELKDAVFMVLNSLNVWNVDKSALSKLLDDNFDKQKEVYCPWVLNEDKEELEDLKKVNEGLDNLNRE